MERDKRVTWDIIILVLLVLLYSNRVYIGNHWAFISDRLSLFTDKHLHYSLVKYFLIRAFCCYVIVVRYPVGVWFVPLLFNFGTIALLLVPAFWETPYGWIFNISGVSISVIASIIAMRIGNKTIKPDNS